MNPLTQYPSVASLLGPECKVPEAYLQWLISNNAKYIEIQDYVYNELQHCKATGEGVADAIFAIQNIINKSGGTP